MEIGDPVGGSVCGWSPCGGWFHSAKGEVVVIRSSSTLEARKGRCDDVVDDVVWDPRGEYLLCVVGLRDLVQVLSVVTMEEVLRIDEGVGGLRAAFWSADGSSVATINKALTRCTVWQGDASDSCYISHPKRAKTVHAHSHRATHTALLTRPPSACDVLYVTDSTLRKVLATFKPATTDANMICFTPNEASHVIVFDSLFKETLFAVYHPITAATMGTALQDPSTGGALTWAFTPTSTYLVIGTNKDMVLIYETATYGLLEVVGLQHKARNVFKEQGRGLPYAGPVDEVLVRREEGGVTHLVVWDDYIAYVCQSCKEYIWFIGTQPMAITHALKQLGSVKSIGFQQGTSSNLANTPHLAVASSSPYLYFWQPLTCSYARTPFTPTALLWRPCRPTERAILLLQDTVTSVMCLALP